MDIQILQQNPQTESTLDLEEKKNILRITSDKPYQSTATFVFE